MLEIGSLVDGKYKILNVVGRGGMSVVYLAMNEKANKQWAIKEVRKDGVSNFDVVKQGLIVETDMLKKFNHPLLPSIVDVIDTNGTFLIVMDYIEGKPLSDSVQENGALPQEDVIKWAIQLCDVLGYLHRQEPPIIYRDMKPANVMLKPDGNITLIDFGTAREYKRENLEDTTCLGTRGYAAPEQFGGQGQTDPRTDIYCLGATLYHLVTGHNPSDPPYEMYPIRYWDESLSQGLENIILKCTQNNPEDRYQSCDELLYALEHYEELDDIYIKKQKRKLSVFLLTTFLMIASFVVAFGAHKKKEQVISSDYETQMETAASTDDYVTKLVSYTTAIAISPEAEEPYIKLLETCETDLIIDEQEATLLNRLTIGGLESELNQIIKSSNSNVKIPNGTKIATVKPLDSLVTNPEAYCNVCYKIGEALWFYYDSETDVSKKTTPINWFHKVSKNEGVSEEQKNNAQMYEKIGEFYRTIAMLNYQGTDSGEYKKLWEYFSTLINEDSLQNTQDAIKVRLYGEVINNITTYSASLKNDGVAEQELISTIQRIQTDLNSISTTNDFMKQDIKNIKSNLDVAMEKVKTDVAEEEEEE